ncbi:unnamed protein product [Eruca vesicaria subsp. sativa]|uniref:Uncharacterized protein n=1 Tax=Eruca vesicaria subsp. sativa TaxID=29727 RepID=A0ABC8JV44_ERUVS|nr:unnamed protein product [Eruca vesicaria subsp. sativa]
MEVGRAYRRGRREVAEVMRYRHDRFSCEFRELKGSYKSLWHYRKCRGTEQWDLIHVSPDTVEAEAGAPKETNEVNLPMAPLDVYDYSIGRSMSRFFCLYD